MVPAFEFKGKALYESLILCEFLEDAYRGFGKKLLTDDPYTKAYIRIWNDHISKNVVPANMRLVMAQGPEKQKAALDEYVAALRAFASKIKGPYFLGEEFSLVDIAVVPFVVRDHVLIEHRGFEKEQVSAEWKEYAERLGKRESVLRTISVSACFCWLPRVRCSTLGFYSRLKEKDKYMTVFGRYLRDEAQSEAAKAIRAGRTIP